jgi:hypothetical protein
MCIYQQEITYVCKYFPPTDTVSNGYGHIRTLDTCQPSVHKPETGVWSWVSEESVRLPDRQYRRHFDFDFDRSWQRSACHDVCVCVCLRQPFVLSVFVSPPTVRAASICVSAKRSCCQYLCSRDFVWLPPAGCLILLCKLVARCAGCACPLGLHNSHTKHRTVPQRIEPRTRASGSLRTVWADRSW